MQEKELHIVVSFSKPKRKQFTELRSQSKISRSRFQTKIPHLPGAGPNDKDCTGLNACGFGYIGPYFEVYYGAMNWAQVCF
jgi:hypothetical protein